MRLLIVCAVLFLGVVNVPAEVTDEIERLSRPSPEAQARLVRMSSYSGASAASAVVRGSTFDGDRMEGLFRRSRPDPARQRRLLPVFSPDAQERLGRRSEFSSGDFERIQRLSDPPEKWVSQGRQAPPMLREYVERQSLLSAEAQGRYGRGSSDSGLSGRLSRRSVSSLPFQEMLQRRSVLSESERRLFRGLSVDRP